jgi:H/ACA ribonucleoprotein complex subunit 4
MEKKKLISEGKLDKYGRVNDNTPNSWKTSFVDLSAVGTKDDPDTSSSVTVPPANLVSTIPAAPATSAQSTEDQEEGTSSAKKVFFFLEKKNFNDYC